MTISYDATTENGIEYVSRIYARNFEYKRIVNDLDGLVVTLSEFSQGSGSVSSYSLGTRSVSRQTMSFEEAKKWWDELMQKKDRSESGRKPRKAVGAVPRDW